MTDQTESPELLTQDAGSVGTSSMETKGSASQAGRPIELIFGLVGPTGVNQDQVCASLKRQLAAVSYKVEEISLSDSIERYDGNPPQHLDKYDRISYLMNKGDELRTRAEQQNIVALLGIIKIRARREALTGSAFEPSKVDRIAYIVRSFKRPEEVELFRDVYGKAFTLISIYASRAYRVDYLKRDLKPRADAQNTPSRSPEELALHLMVRDYNEEGEPFGQRVGETFPLADYFVVGEYRPDLENQLERLIRLIFGDPYISPTADEQAMFFAQAAALRSLDLSRQVGASIISEDGDLLSTGCNEVPKAGGGLYWGEDNAPERDFERGEDANVRTKRELVIDALTRLKGHLKDLKPGETIESLTDAMLFEKPAVLGGSKLFDVIEFGRAVHAEMAAITTAAKLGTSIRGARLFCTTFPCHICARHIVASGVKEVVFVEPYEKSRVAELYQDSIVVEPQEKKSERVVFRSFFGVAPRRYIDFFQPATKRKKKDGRIRDVADYGTSPRIKRITFTYTMAEQEVVKEAKLPSKQEQLSLSHI